VAISRRTVIVVIAILALVGAVYAVAGYQRAQKTKDLLDDLASADLDDAYDAMTALREYGKSVAPKLIEIIEERAPARRLAHARAAMLLNGSGARQAVPTLVKAVQKGEDPAKDDLQLRWCSISALASLDAREAIPEIIKVAKDGSEDLGLRNVAIRALGVLEAQEATDLLVSILENRPPVPPTEEAAKAGEAKPEAGKPQATKAGETGEREAGKAEAAKPAAGTPGAAKPAEVKEPSEALSEEAKVAGARAAAGAEAEAKKATPTTADEKAAADKKKADMAKLRFAAARALAAILPDAAKVVPVMADSLDDEQEVSPDVRTVAAQALAWYDSADSNEALKTAMEDPDPTVRCMAAWALGFHRKTKDQAHDILKVHQEDDHYHTRLAVADSLERLGFKSSRHVKTTKI